ncbi:MAG: hypothetical protein AAGU27_22785 [Dehalobacterium sp.]
MQKLKDLLKRILPPPVKAFMREVNNILSSITKSKKELRAQIEKVQQETALLNKTVAAQNDELKRLYALFESVNRENLRIFLENKKEREEYGKKIEQMILEQRNLFDTASKQRMDLAAKQMGNMEGIKNQTGKASRSAAEAVWAEIFKSASYGSPWLTDLTFSPGRWAVGYPFLYVMYRVLNEFRPKVILELGLGQSTRMIAQYVATNPEVKHYVVEHDQTWIDFFKNDFSLPANTEIVCLDRKMVSFKGSEAVRVFDGFTDRFSGMKFDFISVDAPFGGDMKDYSRIDVLGILPDGLKESFVIMLDDYNRRGEQKTGAEIESVLREGNIEFAAGNYSGDKDLRIWSSPDMKFLCSL